MIISNHQSDKTSASPFVLATGSENQNTPGAALSFNEIHSSCESVHYHVSSNCAYITIDRPEKMNSLNRSMLLGIAGYLDQAESDPEVRVVVLHGNEKAFCTGQDLGELLCEDPPTVEELLRDYHDPVVQKISSCTKPVVAAVNGVAAGAGAVFAMACDLVVASDKASFIFGFSQIGLTSGSGGSYFLTRKVGAQKATALLMLGEKINATEAERIGMIYKVIPQDVFDVELGNLTSKMAQLPAISLSLTKQLISIASENDLNTQILMERRTKCEAGKSSDFAEGVEAFITKRKPVFNQTSNVHKPGTHIKRIKLNTQLKQNQFFMQA
ncbi:MAG: enoyl-CoA hydratase/isomerase family protein [Saprospiraceae bacterium]|nr:enoyl-CoA hydratase/isomerase family protein [Saprospiraceae bacterium]